MASETLPSFVVTQILSKLLSFAAEEMSLARHFEEELKRLAERLKLIQALLSDAESKRTTTTVRVWLKKLETVAYDADVVLDEFAYEILRRKVENRKRDKVRALASLSNNPLSFRLEMAHKIRNINDSLDKIYKETAGLGLKAVDLINYPVEHNEIRVTHPFVDDLEIVGRDDDISTVVNMLTCSGNDDYLSVVAIVGMGGQGKTTLAQLVYKHEKVVKHFDKTVWVCVSDDFNVIKILNEMVESLTGNNPQLSNIEKIIRNGLDSHLKQKKYLLVLDDVWNEDRVKWDCMRNALVGICGSTGSKVMVTACNEEVARVMNTSLTHPLKRLSNEDGWNMFKRRAFADGGAIETDNLVSMGKEVVRSCRGLPLAIKIAGGLMWSKKSENEWSEILASLQNIRDEVLPTLKLSYYNLKSFSLKQCFASCSIFPKDSDIGKDNLIQIWMALGLLQPHGGSGSVMGDIGNTYFNTLLLNSLLEDAKKDEYENVTSCKMHDLVHDLASKNFCLTSEAEVNDDSEIGRLSLISASRKVPEILSRKFPRLRTLYLYGGLIGDSLNNFKCIRVLIVINKKMSELPGSIGMLKHLRYLDISKTEIHTLPDDVTTLYNLQTLRVGYLKELPKKIGKLINLRHVYVEGIKGCQIGRLQHLDQLTGKLRIYGLKDGKKEEVKDAILSNKLQIHALEFHWADEGSRNEGVPQDFHVLERLKPHSNLKGLTIEEFMGGNFASWMMMESQSLLYNLVKMELINCRRCEEIPALGHLPYLKVVEINGMDNVKCIGPKFYGKQMVGGGASTSTGAATITTSFPALRELTLFEMPKLEEWSEVEHPSLVFPCLEVLSIERCKGLRTIPSHFPSIKKLRILGIKSFAARKMSTKLTSLTSLELSCVEGSEVQFVVEELLGNNRLLRQLSISDCDELLYLPTALQALVALQSLYVSSCRKLMTIPELCTSLEELTMWHCPAVVSLPDFQCLRKLVLWKFSKELDYFPWASNPTSSYVQHLLDYFLWASNPTSSYVQHLQELKLGGWPKLTSLPEQLQHLSALTSLHLEGFDGLVALPEWLGKLSSLQHLYIVSCKNLISMPTAEAMQRLAKLRRLEIEYCPLLGEKCTQETRPEWNKIAHIPEIQINGKRYR